MESSGLQAGQVVSWDTRDGASTVRITGVHSYRVSYVCRDGVPEMWEATCYRTLNESLPRGLRQATADEVSGFERLFRPAPVNYY